MLAQEVVQEAFLAAWQHAPARFEPAHGLLANGRCQALPARSRLACTRRTMAARESSNWLAACSRVSSGCNRSRPGYPGRTVESGSKQSRCGAAAPVRATAAASSSPSRKRRKTRKTPAAASSAKPYLVSADRNDSLQRRLGSGGPRPSGGRRQGGGQQEQLGMGQRGAPDVVRQPAKVVLPPFSGVQQQARVGVQLVDDVLGDAAQQSVATREQAIQRHDRDVDLVGEAAHRQPAHTVPFDDLGGCGHDQPAVELPAWFPYSPVRVALPRDPAASARGPRCATGGTRTEWTYRHPVRARRLSRRSRRCAR